MLNLFSGIRFLSLLFSFFFINSLTLLSQRLHLLHENTFEESTTGDAYLYGYENTQHCCSYSVQRSNEISTIGSYALRLEVRSTDAATSGSIRSEIVPDDESHPLDVDRWYGFKMYLKNWADDNTAGEHVFQWHPDNPFGSSALSLWAGGGRFVITTNNTGTTSNNVFTDIGPVLNNQWVDFVIHVRWDDDASNNTGVLEVWMNGTKVINRHNVKTAAVTNYFKLGINKFGWPGGSITNRTLFFDEVRIGDENATYDDVAPPSTTPTATATLSGEVLLQGRPAAPDPMWRVPLQVKIYSTSNSTLLNIYNVTTSPNGRLIITNLTPGTYHIAVKNSHSLQRINLTQTLSANNNVINFGTLLEGDANNDDWASLSDLSIQLNTYNKAVGEVGYDGRADFNEDGVVSAEDFSLLVNNYNYVGEEITEGCALVTGTIAASATCNGSAFNITLNSATGASPFAVRMEDGTGIYYENVNVGTVLKTFTPYNINFWGNDNPNAVTNGPDNVSGGPNIELGVKFSSAEAGFVKGIRFFTANSIGLGPYIGSLWTSTGTKLAEAQFTATSDFIGNQWIELTFSTPLLIQANTTYIASYHTTNKYVSTTGGLSNIITLSSNSLPEPYHLTIPANGSVYKYGISSFPDQPGNGANYWVDIVFTPAVFKFNLLSITDNNGCNNTRLLQALTVTSISCP